jgi:hypothetical protein
MPQFMLILSENPGEYKDMSPEEIQKIIEKYAAWTKKVGAAGKLVGGQKLMEEGGKRMTRTGAKLTVVDGPYAESKEVVGGYFILKAADYGEAVELAADCPHLQFGRIDVRQVDFMGRPEP